MTLKFNLERGNIILEKKKKSPGAKLSNKPYTHGCTLNMSTFTESGNALKWADILLVPCLWDYQRLIM